MLVGFVLSDSCLSLVPSSLVRRFSSMDQVGVGVPSPPASRSDTVTFVRDGHDNVDLLVDQATPQVISRLFSVSLASQTCALLFFELIHAFM